ncbi:hypothetical protein FDECE_724 [Fusarium decemcellulare]|nr:hypothetical protein FDECE_724 [Fusarium decemcellulare]
MAGAMYTSVDVDVLLKRPLGELAQQVRVSIQQQATDEQIRAQLRKLRRLGHAKTEPLYGNPDAHLVVFSNWTKCDLFNDVDFSPAVSKSKSVGNNARIGRLTYMHYQSLGENRFQRDCFGITGKDLDGSYWVSAFLYTYDWQKLEDYIRETCSRIQ